MVLSNGGVDCNMGFPELLTVNQNGVTHAFDLTLPMYVTFYSGTVRSDGDNDCALRNLPPVKVSRTSEKVLVDKKPYAPH